MILPSEHLRTICALKWGLARVLADVIDCNLIRENHLSDRWWHYWREHNYFNASVYVRLCFS